jgi:hypothetical protein
MPAPVFENHPLLTRNYSCTIKPRRLALEIGSAILQFLSKIFWRLVLPILLGFSLAIAWMLKSTARSPGEFWFLPIPSAYLPRESIDYSPFRNPVGARSWNTLLWGKEAEGFETNLIEADAIEKERRRRSFWIER